ncbi:P-type conjugative transfer protein TrbL [Undibacterium griseum]|uniref:P-type conjugative transfer protein TrbL n=1 Tax=Undibacterium griseum TaxID=2762295 RepID=A0ABR6YMB5_9BURK|nr:P-type conjugative transfer protein TrbL [Undibacterium griseum]MBC3884935.1 P-type conjugative transfer protein TrbL [Undibacterium griseum]
MKQRNLFLLAFGLLMIASPAFADTTGYDLGSIMDKYQAAATQFGSNITAVALKLCYTLFAIDLAWTVLGRLLKGSDIVEIGSALIMRVMWVGLVVWVINNPSVPLAFVNGFIQLGKTGANTSAISPGDVFWQGIDLVNMMMTKFSDNATVAGVPVPAGIAAMANPFAAILIGIALIVIVVCYAMLAAQFAVAWVQLWFYLAVYPIVLAFGAMKWTKDIAMKVITTPLVYGVRFMAIYFIMAVGTTLAQDFGTEIGNLSLTNLTPIWTILAGSVLLFMLTLKVPTLAADLLGGTASLSAGDGVGAGLVAGGAVAAVAGGAYAAGSTLANDVGGAIKTGQAAITQAREKGATGVMGTAAGAAGAVGSAVGEAAMEGIKGLGGDSMGGRLAGRIDTKTAGIRESKAAASVSAPSVPGSQPPAPASGESSPATTTPQAPPATEGSQSTQSAAAPTETPPEPTRDTPAAPTTSSTATGQPGAPAATSTDVTAPALATPPAQNGLPAEAPSAHTPPIAAPVANAERVHASDPVAVAAALPTGDTADAESPGASSKAALAVKAVLNEVQKTSGSGGGSVQTSHGNE